MARKPKQKAEARRLRKQEGLSLDKISEKVGVAKSTVSLWVRDINLTGYQKVNLKRNIINTSKQNAKKTKEEFKRLRREYQNQGRRKAKEKDWLHTVGCMLYWAEGYKSQNRSTISFANSDPCMLKLFIEFLQERLGVKKEKICLKIKCYTNNGISLEEIKEYWIRTLGLSKSSLRGVQVNALPKSSKKKRGNILPYGTCYLQIFDVQLTQHIFGAIQEYGKIEGENWLD